MYSEIITNDYTPFGSGIPRSPGLHVSTIVRYVQKKLGMLKTAEGWDMGACSDTGFLWETALSYAYRDRRVLGWDDPEYVVSGVCGDIFRPEEQEMDGIILSPDGYGPDPKEKVPVANHEFKCTWRSSNKQPCDDFYWDKTFKAYCRSLGTNVTVLHVMYLMGNYKGSGPQHRVYRFEFSDDEIEKTWRMVLRHKKDAGREKDD